MRTGRRSLCGRCKGIRVLVPARAGVGLDPAQQRESRVRRR